MRYIKNEKDCKGNMEKEKWERKRGIVKKIQSKREKDCKEKSERKIVKKLGECERNKKEKGRNKENKEKEKEWDRKMKNVKREKGRF